VRLDFSILNAKCAKERENMEIKEFFYTNLYLKRWFWNGIHSLLGWADARGRADIIYRV